MKTLPMELFERAVIAIVRGVRPGDIAAVADALLAGGVSMMEVTFDHASPDGVAATLESLEILRDSFGDAIVAGAGTVLTAEEVALARDRGARYIISPNVDQEVIAKTRELGLVSMPGAFTPSEVAAAHKMGAHIVKLFPAGLGGIDYLKALSGPLGHIPIAAVGGIEADNIAAFLHAGAHCFGVGGNLVDAGRVAAGDFAAITTTARALNDALASV